MRGSELLLSNGIVRTMDPRQPLAQALCVRDGRIVFVGADADAQRWADAAAVPAARRIDLRGRLALPGFIDAHLHFVSFGLGLQQVDLAPSRSLVDALALVRQRAAAALPGAWVSGGGWDHDAWELDGYPTRHMLDSAAPQHPVLLRRKDGHSAWADTLALQLAGVTSTTPDPPGGSIDREPDGAPAGMLREGAILLVASHVPTPDAQQRRAAALHAQEVAHAAGLTSVHNMEGADSLRTLQELHAAGQLTLRVTQQVPHASLDAALTLGLRSGLGDGTLRIGAVKLFADGSLGSRTAAMLADYHGEPGNRGMLLLSPQELADTIGSAYAGGLSVAIHAIGDAANRAALDALAHHRDLAHAEGLRPRIEHVQLLHQDDVPRLASIGVVASMQPLHATQDMAMADRFWGTRSRFGYAWRALLDSGAVLAFGSDCPVETLDVRQGLWAAITRQRADGTPAGGWHAEQRLTLVEALAAYTTGAAFAAGQETAVGSLTPGRLADVVVLECDLLAGPPEQVLAAQVDLTICGGRVVFDRDG
jgi:predicted amidohydrolase YtcJ